MLQLDESENECKEADKSIVDVIDDGDIDCISNISVSSDDNILNDFSQT